MAGMTKQEVLDSLDDALNQDKNTLLPRIFRGTLIHAKKYLEEQRAPEELPATEKSVWVVGCGLYDPKIIVFVNQEDAEKYYNHLLDTEVKNNGTYIWIDGPIPISKDYQEDS